jgi:hypothetical protein
MLLGCCHCGETPSESTPPSVSQSQSQSQSVPSVSESPISERPLVCGDCDAVPYRWKVTLTGWGAAGSFPTHATCCGNRNASFIVSQHVGAFPYLIGGLNVTNFCRIWKSAEFAKNHTASPPICTDLAPPLIAMGLRGSGLSATVIDLSVYTAFTGFTPIGIHGFTRQSAGQCFYSGTLNYDPGSSSSNPRCSHGTVTVEPA